MEKAFFALTTLFCWGFSLLYPSDKWIVVTTIQYPTEQLKKLSRIPGWSLVVVGDKKTPADWYLENCEYLSPERQLSLGYDLAPLLPWNHYSRKNIGYLFALERGASIIYETDDDNEILDGLSPCCSECFIPEICGQDRYVNMYAYFGHPEVWPRGFPLNFIHHANLLSVSSPKRCFLGIEQGVVNGSPDVDALFRLTQDKEVVFETKPACSLPPGSFCPMNSQNTFFYPKAFFTLYLPSFVSMRVSDIWRGYIAQKLLWDVNVRIAFSGPSVFQKRNEHCLLHDFYLEQALYLQSEAFVDFLYNWNSGHMDDAHQTMAMLFQDLVQRDFLKKEEIPLLKAWLHDLKKVTAGLPREMGMNPFSTN